MRANPYPSAPTLKTSCNQINIMLLIDIVYTLVDVVIIDLIRIDLVSWAIIFNGVATIIAIQMKDGLYHD
jgi:hypothetical protein